MIRVIIREVNHAAAANVDAPVEITFTTIDVDAPAVEAFMSAPRRMNDHYTTREIIGVEVVADALRSRQEPRT